MSTLRYLAFYLSLLVVSATALGEPVVSGAAIPSNLHIYSTNGAAYVALVRAGCATSGIYSLAKNHPAYSEIFSMLLTAQSTGQTVKIRFDGCEGTRGKIIGIYLKG